MSEIEKEVAQDEEMQAKMARLAVAIEDKRESVKADVEELALMKDKLSMYMEKSNVDMLVIGLGEEELVVKQNRRSTAIFDKDELSRKTVTPKEELNYEGVCKLVEEQQITAEEVGRFYKPHKYTFISVRRRAYVPPKAQ